MILGAVSAANDALAQGVFIPVTTRRDIVFDHSGKYLYITTTDGWVRRYNLATGQLEPGYNLGGSLGGADIAADDSFLLVAQRTTPANAQGMVHKLDLRTGLVTNAYYNSDNDRGSNDVAIASNGLAFVTPATTAGKAFTYLRQWDLATNTLTERSDTPGTGPGGLIVIGSWVSRSEDGTRLAISEDNGTTGCFTYSALTNTFGPSGNWPSQRTALNRDGTLVATGFCNGSVALDTAPEYVFLHSFPGLGGPGLNGGVAFDATTDILYAVSIYSNAIIAYNAKSFVEIFRLPVGEDLYYPGDVASLVASHDGHYLALATHAGVRLFAVPVAAQPPGAPVFDLPTDMVFDHTGIRLYINTIFGQVWPYNLITGNLETPFDLGGSLTGLDIAADDSFLLVGQYYRGVRQGMFQKVDLNDRTVTNLKYTMQFHDAGGAWDVAIGAQGLALATSHYGLGSVWLSLLQIDPAKNQISIRRDAPGSSFSGDITGKTIIHRSADRTRFLFLEPDSTQGHMFTYDAITNSFGPYYNYGNFFDFDPGAINRNGTLVATRHYDMTVLAAPSLTVARTVPAFGGSGIAFDAVRDILYSVKGSQVIAYDTNAFTEKFRLNIGEQLPNDWSQFNVGNIVASQDGNYLAVITPTTLRVLNVATGAVAALPTPPPTVSKGRLANISTRAVVKNGDNVTIAGFILLGRNPEKVFVRAIGPSLTAAGVPGAMDDPVLELYDSAGILVRTNDNWKDSVDQAQIISAGLAPKDSREACLLGSLNPGAYTAVLRGKNQTTGTALIELYGGGPQNMGTDQLIGNISTRGLVGVDDDVMIAGFITNRGTTRILVRGIGPSLAAFNVPDPLQDPLIELHDSNGALMTSNDNWQETNPAEIWNTSIAPTNDRESALIITLSAGSYTAILRGRENSTGNGLVEVYSL